MRCVRILAVAMLTGLPLALPSAARADETDDVLAKRMSALVRDFRQPLPARVEAARVLEKLGARASAAVPDLVAVLDRLRGTEHAPLQEAVVEALGQIGTASRVALPSLAKATYRTVDIDLAVKRSTEQILASPESQMIDTLMQQLLSRDVGTRLKAAKSLADLGPVARTAVPTLTGILTDTDNDVRRAAINAIRQIQPNVQPSEAYVRAVAVDLRDPDANWRLLAVRTLGRIGPPAAIVAGDLEVLRSDPDPDIRRAVAEAIARVAVPIAPPGP